MDKDERNFMNKLISKYSYNYQVIDDDVCRTCGMHETGERGIQMLVEEPEGRTITLNTQTYVGG